MIWAVLDTNTLVSGMGWRGPPSLVVDLALAGRFILVTTRALLDELADVIQRPALAAHFHDPPSIALLVETVSVIVEPTAELDVVQNDPDDNRVLEAAQAGRADFIVTGDSDLLVLGVFDGIEIVTPQGFLANF